MKDRIIVGIVSGVLAVIFLVLMIFVLNTFVDLNSTDLKSNLEKAYLEGYNDVPFHEIVEKYGEEEVQYAKSEGLALYDFSLKWEEGWNVDGAPKYEPTSNEIKVTLCASTYFHNEEGKEIETMSFFMVYNEKSNTLSIYGGALDEGGMIYINEYTDESELMEFFSTHG